MNGAEVIRRLHQHRSWTNAKLMQAAAALSADVLHRPLPIGQGTLWKTLVHLYAAEYVWLGALQGNETPLVPGDVPELLPGNQEGEGAFGSLNDLAIAWAELEGRWWEFLTNLNDSDLDKAVFKVSTSSRKGKRLATRTGDILLHLCTHAQYTTAQAVNMLRHLGATIPDVMLITLARQSEPAVED